MDGLELLAVGDWRAVIGSDAAANGLCRGAPVVWEDFIGTGSHGQVLRVSLGGQSFAHKAILPGPAETVIHEIVLYTHFEYLRYRGIAPDIVPLRYAYWRDVKDCVRLSRDVSGEVAGHLFMDLAGEPLLKRVIDIHDGKAPPVAAVEGTRLFARLLLTVLGYTNALGLQHCDCYLRNMVILDVPDREYLLPDRTCVVVPRGLAVGLVDFGLSCVFNVSHLPKLFGVTTSERSPRSRVQQYYLMPMLTSLPRAVQFARKNSVFKNEVMFETSMFDAYADDPWASRGVAMAFLFKHFHVTEFLDMPFFAYDIAAVLFSASTFSDATVARWGVRGLGVLADVLARSGRKAAFTTRELSEVVTILLSPEFAGDAVTFTAAPLGVPFDVGYDRSALQEEYKQAVQPQ